MKKCILLLLCVFMFLLTGILRADNRWYSQEQIMNSVFDPSAKALIIKSTSSMYAGKVSTGTSGIMTSPGTIFNASGDVLYIDYYVKGGSGVDTEITNSKMGGTLKIPSGVSKDTPFFANPLISPVIELKSLTPGATLYYEVIYQIPE